MLISHARSHATSRRCEQVIQLRFMVDVDVLILSLVAVRSWSLVTLSILEAPCDHSMLTVDCRSAGTIIAGMLPRRRSPCTFPAIAVVDRPDSGEDDVRNLGVHDRSDRRIEECHSPIPDLGSFWRPIVIAGDPARHLVGRRRESADDELS